jgi:hypothetical protein
VVKAFGAEVQQANDPSYIGYSREGDANTSLKKLFSGIAGVIDDKAKFYEEQEKEKATEVGEGITESEVQTTDKESDLIAGGTGENALAGGAQTSGQVDLDAQNVVRRGTKLKDAYAAGRITETQYWSQMDAMVKQAKARYPGPMGRRIEAAVTTALGARPASKAVESAREEYKSSLASANEEEKRFGTFVDTNIEHLPPDYFARQKGGNPYTKLETRAWVQDSQQQDLKNKRKQTDLAIARDQGNLNEETAVATATDEATSFVNRILLNTADVSGSGTDKFQTQLRKAQEKGKDLTPDEQMALRQSFGELRLKVAQGIENLLSKNWEVDGKQYNYYNTIRNPEKIKQIREQAMARINQYEQYINDKDYGLLNADINRTKALKDEANRTVLESSDEIRLWQSIKEQGGEGLLNEFYVSPEGTKMKNAAIKAFRNMKVAGRMAGESTSLGDDMRQAGQLSAPAKEKSALNYQMIQDSVKTLTSPKATPDMQSHTARYMFGPKNADFLANVKPSQATEIYTRMVSPEMTKTMLQVKEHDPEAWNLYKTWATDSFGALFRNLASSVQEGVTARPWVDVKWDAKGNQFVVTDNPSRPKGKGAFSGIVPRFMEERFTKNVETSVSEFNRQIAVLAPILKADNYEVGEELLGLFKEMGIDDMAPKEASFFAKLRDSLAKSYTEEQGGDRTDANGKK